MHETRIFSKTGDVLTAVLLLFFAVPVHAEETFSREDVAALAKPAVVRIVEHIKGQAVLPGVDIDIKTRSVKVNPKKPSTTLPVDEYLSGSGLIISSDGKILTNAHVVSQQSIKLDLVSQVILPQILSEAAGLSEEEYKNFFEDQTQAYRWSQEIFESVSLASQFDFDQRIVVLDPASRQEKTEDLLNAGFPASVETVNDQFYADDKDIAVIKIEKTDLPALSLGSSQGLGTGKVVYAIGFPATAEFNQRNPAEATFTQGVISAFKDSQGGDFQVIQTDAKVSQGSSGGPLLDETGHVVGVVTFQSDDLQRGTGDNFAFAVPIDTVKNVLNEKGIGLDTGEYEKDFRSGVMLAHNRNCRQSLAQFDQIKQSGDTFQIERSVAPYVSQCEALLVSGRSADTLTGWIADTRQTIGPWLWFTVVFLIVLVIVLGVLLRRLFRRLRQEETEIHSLENRLEEEEKLLKKDHEMIESLSQGGKKDKFD